MQRLIPIVTLALLFIAPGILHAKEMDDRYGAGAESTITGDPTVNATYFLTDQIALQGTVGYLNVNFSDDLVSDVSIFLVGVGGTYNFFVRPRTHLAAVATVAFGVGDSDAIRFFAGIRPELFVTDWLSFHTTVGLTYLKLGEKSAGGGGLVPITDISGLSLFKGSALAQAGVTFYFGGRSIKEQPISTPMGDDDDDDDDDDSDHNPGGSK